MSRIDAVVSAETWRAARALEKAMERRAAVALPAMDGRLLAPQLGRAAGLWGFCRIIERWPGGVRS